MEKSKCVVCGNKIVGEVVKQEYGGEEYHFCSEECRFDFLLNEPDKYKSAWSSREGEAADAETLKCAVCGNGVFEEDAHKQEYREEKSYEKYYFCSAPCRVEFLNTPDKYMGQSGKHLT